MKSIAHSLADSASDYASRALGSYVDQEYADFYLFAGIAIEQAMKARLARENPTFIAPSGQFKSAVALWRARDDGSKLLMGTTTIGGKEAVERVTQLEPSFGDHASGAMEILKYRNGEAHLGGIDATHHRRGLIAFLRAINALLRIEPDEFWRPHEELVRIALDENTAEVVRLVQLKMSRARRLFESRIGALTAEQVEAFNVAVRAGVDKRVEDDVKEMQCPACESPATVSGDNTIEAERSYEDDSGSYWIQFTALVLECEACGLELDGEAEFQALNLETTWPNDEIDFYEFMRENYSDE